MQNSPDQDVVPAVEWRDMMLRSMDALSARVGALDDSVNSLRQVTTTLFGAYVCAVILAWLKPF